MSICAHAGCRWNGCLDPYSINLIARAGRVGHWCGHDPMYIIRPARAWHNKTYRCRCKRYLRLFRKEDSRSRPDTRSVTCMDSANVLEGRLGYASCTPQDASPLLRRFFFSQRAPRVTARSVAPISDAETGRAAVKDALRQHDANGAQQENKRACCMSQHKAEATGQI